jgi:PilZ domain
MDKRRFRRMDFQAPAVITQESETYSGEVENLSTMGLFVKAQGTFRTDDNALVSIRFSDGANTISVTMPAKIARSTADGVAFHSPHINLYPILHLEHLFIYRKGKPEQLTEDFCEYISKIWECPASE